MDNEIPVGSNIARNRRERGLTQEELAAFLGVTKASVSKWETGQSYPDIALLPRIATYFGISIDELVGYRPQMSDQAIRMECARLRTAFAEGPFDRAHNMCRALARDYFSCYPLLLQIATLYANHVDLAGPGARGPLIEEAIGLCGRVRRGAKGSGCVRQAESVEAILLLMKGGAKEAADLLKDSVSPDMGADIILARAYSALGMTEEADTALQSMLYQALVLSLSRLADLAMLHASEPDRLESAHVRALHIIDSFGLEKVFGNVASVHLSFAAAFSVAGDADGAIGCLEDYVRSCRAMRFDGAFYGDAFFDKLGDWFERASAVGADMPRDEKRVRASLLEGVAANPAFASLSDDPRFERIVASLEEVAHG